MIPQCFYLFWYIVEFPFKALLYPNVINSYFQWTNFHHFFKTSSFLSFSFRNVEKGKHANTLTHSTGDDKNKNVHEIQKLPRTPEKNSRVSFFVFLFVNSGIRHVEKEVQMFNKVVHFFAVHESRRKEGRPMKHDGLA